MCLDVSTLLLEGTERRTFLDSDASLGEARGTCGACWGRQVERSWGAFVEVFATVGTGGDGDEDGVGGLAQVGQRDVVCGARMELGLGEGRDAHCICGVEEEAQGGTVAGGEGEGRKQSAPGGELG